MIGLLKKCQTFLESHPPLLLECLTSLQYVLNIVREGVCQPVARRHVYDIRHSGARLMTGGRTRHVIQTRNPYDQHYYYYYLTLMQWHHRVNPARPLEPTNKRIRPYSFVQKVS